MNLSKCTRRVFRLLRAAAALVSLATSTVILGEPRSWDGGGGGDTSWNNPLNWNPDGVPTSTTDVTLGSGITPDLTIGFSGGDETINSLTIATANAFTVTGSPVFFKTLVLQSGDLVRQNVAGVEASQKLVLRVRMGDHGVWNIGGSAEFSVQGGLADNLDGIPRNFTKTGDGLLEIFSARYTGTTTVSQGILRLRPGSLGSNLSQTITIAAGAELQLDGVFGNPPIQLQSTGTAAILRNFAGLSTVGQVTLGQNNPIFSDSGTLEIRGGITDGAFSRSWSKNGAGRIRLTGPGTYEGDTFINAGILSAERSDALGSGAARVGAGATLELDFVGSLPNNISLDLGTLSGAASGASSVSGNITLTSNATIRVDGAAILNLTGSITDSGQGSTLTKSGDGVLSFNASGTLPGPLVVAEGTFRRFSQTPSESITVQSGGTFELAGNAGIEASIQISGNGANGEGALLSTAVNTWTGQITLAGGSSIGVGNSAQLTLDAGISGGFGWSKLGPGTLVLRESNNNYGGATEILAGTLRLAGGNIPDGSAVTLGNFAGAILDLDGNSETIGSLTLGGPAGGAVALGSATLTTGGDNTSTIFAGTISGSGGLVKVGTGVFTISGNNTYAGLTSIQQGTLRLGAATGTPQNAVLNIAAGATFDLNGINDVLSALSGSGQVLLGTANLTIGAANASSSFGGSIGGSGALVKIGAGTFALGGANTYSGGTIINGGALSISSDTNLGDPANQVTLNNGGKLLVTGNAISARTFNLNTGSIQVGSGATLTYNGATVLGGFLRGPGTHSIGGSSNFSGVAALAGTSITQTGQTLLNNFTNSGAFTNNAPLTWEGGYNTGAGSLVVNSTLTTSGFENNGQITINNAAAMTNTGNALASTGGSRITINPGGVLNVSGNSLELNGALFVNNGTLTGTTNVNYGSLAKGSGVYGAVNVTDGGKFSPGNSPGSVVTGSTTWNSGGSYVVEIGDTSSPAGHDFWQVNGLLNLNASAQHPFTISLASIDGLIFDSSRDYTWPILHAADGIVDFDLSALALDTTAFIGNGGAGRFWLQSTPTDLIVNFAAVPEPAVMGLLAAGTLLLCRTRRNR